MPCASNLGRMRDRVSPKGTMMSTGSMGCLEAVEKALHPVDLPADRPGEVPHEIRVAEAVGEHLGERLDRHQRVPNLVNHAGSDGLVGGEALGPLPFALQLLDPREVGE